MERSASNWLGISWYRVPPMAVLRSWMPRQMPKMGFPNSMTRGTRDISRASLCWEIFPHFALVSSPYRKGWMSSPPVKRTPSTLAVRSRSSSSDTSMGKMTGVAPALRMARR